MARKEIQFFHEFIFSELREIRKTKIEEEKTSENWIRVLIVFFNGRYSCDGSGGSSSSSISDIHNMNSISQGLFAVDISLTAWLNKKKKKNNNKEKGKNTQQYGCALSQWRILLYELFGGYKLRWHKNDTIKYISSDTAEGKYTNLSHLLSHQHNFFSLFACKTIKRKFFEFFSVIFLQSTKKNDDDVEKNCSFRQLKRKFERWANWICEIHQ